MPTPCCCKENSKTHTMQRPVISQCLSQGEPHRLELSKETRWVILTFRWGKHLVLTSAWRMGMHHIVMNPSLWGYGYGTTVLIVIWRKIQSQEESCIFIKKGTKSQDYNTQHHFSLKAKEELEANVGENQMLKGFDGRPNSSNLILSMMEAIYSFCFCF